MHPRLAFRPVLAFPLVDASPEIFAPPLPYLRDSMRIAQCEGALHSLWSLCTLRSQLVTIRAQYDRRAEPPRVRFALLCALPLHWAVRAGFYKWRNARSKEM